MGNLKFCSACGSKNIFGFIDGNDRFHCPNCKAIHYQNPKPTATLICPKDDSILLVERACDPGKGEWGLPGGFMELDETLFDAAIRELKEETNLTGSTTCILGSCSHFGSIFGDILLIGILMEIKDSSWKGLCAMDDASDAQLFNLNELPPLAFYCHKKIVEFYLELIQDKL